MNYFAKNNLKIHKLDFWGCLKNPPGLTLYFGSMSCFPSLAAEHAPSKEGFCVPDICLALKSCPLLLGLALLVWCLFPGEGEQNRCI